MTTTQQHQEAINQQETIWEVSDDLWGRLKPLLIVDKPRKKSGRPALDNRPLFNGLIWMARTGSQWKEIPRRYGAKSTIHERFTDWITYHCLERAWQIVLEEYDDLVGIEWEWQAADGCIVKAPLGKRGLPASRKRRAAIPQIGGKQAANGTF